MREAQKPVSAHWPAQPACNNFTNSVTIPSVGSHVQIVGSYVRDTNHAQWMEIHPVTSIKIIP
jgi:hypothetical protein